MESEVRCGEGAKGYEDGVSPGAKYNSLTKVPTVLLYFIE